MSSPSRQTMSPGLTSGKAQYSLLLNDGGGVVDDIIVYCRGENDYLIVLNAGCKDKDWDWLQAQAIQKSNVALADVSGQTALLAVQGPNAVSIAVQAFNMPELVHLKRFHFARVEGAVTFSRTGYTGEDGFEIFCDWQEAPMLWQALTAAGAMPAGLGARDVLRLEAAYPLYGHELDAETQPNESGVGWAVKMSKGDFTGRDALQNRIPTLHLVGLRMSERAIPREHYSVLTSEGLPIGETTSGTWSPTVKAGIALARLDSNFAASGTAVS